MVHDFSLSMLKDSKEQGELATLAHTETASLALNETQAKGDIIGDSSEGATLVQGRVLVGSTASSKDPVVFSLYYVNLKTEQTEVMQLVRMMVPKDILAREGDTKESLAARQGQSRWLDEITKHGQRNKVINGDPSNKTPMRRTVAVMDDRPRKIFDLESKDHQRSVVSTPCYRCYEQPVVFWSSWGMRQVELAFMLECWVKARP